MIEALRQSLAEKLPEATLLGVWIQEGPDIFGVPGKRAILIYAASSSELNGLRHWEAERCWYEGESFVSAFEAAVFCRMLMQGHPLVRATATQEPIWWLEQVPMISAVESQGSGVSSAFSLWSDWLSDVRRLLTLC